MRLKIGAQMDRWFVRNLRLIIKAFSNFLSKEYFVVNSLFLKTILFLFFSLNLPKVSYSDSVPSREWIESLRIDVDKIGVSAATWDEIQLFLKFDTRVKALHKSQPEFTEDLTSYYKKRLTKSKIDYGKKMLKKHGSLLDSIEVDFNVSKELIVSLWGLESDFGRFQGNFNIITSLTSLAAGRRARYFRGELLEAIVLYEESNLQIESFVGSWAGAIGQCQFMPWNARKYGIDYDQNGIVDLKNSTSDALASMANFLRSLGWNDSFTWGRPVSLSDDIIEDSLLNGQTTYSLKHWEEIGVRRINGDSLPDVVLEARLLRPKNSGGRIYLIYSNFDVIMKWNRSHYFALTVGSFLNQLKNN